VSALVVGVPGGTDDRGRGLAYRLARTGRRVILGSRAADRARRAAAELGHDVEGADNAECARRSDIVIVAVPWDGHAEILQSLRAYLAGKLVVDCVNPLGCDKQGAYALSMPEGSAAHRPPRCCRSRGSPRPSTTCPPRCCRTRRSRRSTRT
jgi:8-hydroxy-5-deazaflavin:NADPH oxidoreductase